MADEKFRIKLSSPKLQGAHAKGDSSINNGTLLPIDSNQMMSPTISPKSLCLTPLESSPIGSPFLVPQQVKMPMIGSKKSSDSPAATCSKPLTDACPSRTARPTKSTVLTIGSTEKNLISSSIIAPSCDYDDESLAAISQVNPALSSPMNPIRAEKSASPFMIDTKDCNPQQPQQQQQQHRHHQYQLPTIKSANINRRNKYANANGMMVVGHSNSNPNRRGVSVSPSPSKKEPLEDKLDKYQLHIFGRGLSFSVSTLLPIMFYVAIGTIAVIALAFIHEWHSSITNLVYAGRSTIETNSHMFRRELSGRAVSAVLNLMESAASATKVISNTFSEDYLSKAYIEDDIGRFSDAFVRVYSAYNEFSTMAIVTQHSGAEHMFIVQRLDNSGGAATYGAIDGDRTTVTKMFFYDADFTPTQRLAGINETSFEAIPFWSRRNATSEPMLWFMSKSSSALRSQSDVLIGFIQKIHRKEDGSLLAVVSTGFTAHRISNILSSLPLTKNSMVFIISSAPPYKFIAGKNIEPLAYDPTNFSAFEHPSGIVRETTKVWAATNGFTSDGDVLADNHGTGDVLHDNHGGDSSYDDPNEFLVCDGTVIVNARRINNSYNMDLTLFILVPKDDVVGPVVAQYTRFSRTYSSIIGCFVCITAFACVTSHYFGRKFSNKCKSIAKSLENIISLDESDVYTDSSDTITAVDSDDDVKASGMSSFHLNDSTGPRSERAFSSGSSDPSKNALTGSDNRAANENLCKCGRRHKQIISKNASDTQGGDKKEPAKSLIGPKLSSLQMSFASYFSSPRLPPAPGSEISTGMIVREIHEMDKSVSRVSRMVKNFARYIPLPVVRMYMKNRKSPELKLDSRYAVIMFLDIANFTWLSEQLGDAMISALNKLFEEFSNILIEYGAVIDKYMGDAIMALWNVPEEIDMPEARAAKAAIRIIQRLDQLNEDYFPSNYGCTMGLRIGLNCGDVYAGNVGVPQRMNYTVLGNNVNIAARLEPLNKELGTRILVTDSFRRACSGSCLGADVMFRCLGATCLRGMKSPVVVHQVLGDPEFVPVVIAMKLGVYRAIDSVLIECARGIRPAGAAREAYEKYLSVNGDDKAIRYFYDHLD